MKKDTESPRALATISSKRIDKDGQYRALLWTKKGTHHATFPNTFSKSDGIFSAVAQTFSLEKGSLKNLSRINSEDFTKISGELLKIEESGLPNKMLFGIVYGKDKQTNLDEMFSNETGSDNFYTFMDMLGARVDLENVDEELMKFAGFVGADFNQKIQVYVTKHIGIDICFHVSTLLPFNSADEQQLARKRKIGNDIVVVVYNESTESFDPSQAFSKVKNPLI